jgi:hypothetical protein
MELLPEDVTTGGAARATAAVAAKMRDNPPPMLSSPDAAPQPADKGPTPEQPAKPGPTPDAPAKPDAGKDAPTTDAPTRLVSAVDLDKKPTAPSGSEDDAVKSKYKELLAKHGGDPEKLAEAVFETNKRASDLAKENEQLKGGKPEATETETTDEPLQLDPETRTAIAQRLEQIIYQDDPECRTWNKQYIDRNTRLSAILKTEEVGGQITPVGGELFDTSRKLNFVKGLLDPKGVGDGLGVRELDAVEREELEQRKLALEITHERLLSEHDRISREMADLHRNWTAKRNAYADRLLSEARSKIGTKQTRVAEVDVTAEASRTWDQEFARATEGMTPAERRDAEARLLQLADDVYDAGGDIMEKPGQLTAWFDKQIKPIKADFARRQGADDKARAKAKEPEVRQVAPRGTAADADTRASRPADSRQARRDADRRADLRARDIRRVPA